MKCEPIFLSCSGYKSLETAAAAAFTLKWQVLPLTDHNLINGDMMVWNLMKHEHTRERNMQTFSHGFYQSCNKLIKKHICNFLRNCTHTHSHDRELYFCDIYQFLVHTGWETRGETEVGIKTAWEAEERYCSGVPGGLCPLHHREETGHVRPLQPWPEGENETYWLPSPSRQGTKSYYVAIYIFRKLYNYHISISGLEAWLGSSHPVQGSPSREHRRGEVGEISGLPSSRPLRQPLPHQRLC